MPYVRQVNAAGLAVLSGGVGWLVSKEQAEAHAACCTCPCLSCNSDDANFSANLVVNGGFEGNLGNTSTNVAPVNWTVVSGTPTVIRPDAIDSATIGDGYPVPPEGAQFLAGGFNPGSPTPAANAVSILEQVIDVSAYSDAIDSDRGCFYCSAYLGMFGDETTAQDDVPVLQFFVAGVAIVTMNLDGPGFGFAPINASGRLARGTRTVTVRYTGTKDALAPAGYSNDAYLDDVRFHMCAPTN